MPTTVKMTVYYKDVEISLDIVAQDLDGIKETAEYYLENGFTAKRAYEKKTGDKVDWTDKIVVVDSITPVEGKKYFDVNFHERAEPDNKGKIIAWDKKTYRAGDVLVLFKNDKGFLTGELWSDKSFDDIPL